MANLFLAAFLIVFGLNILIGLDLPAAVTGVLALVAGILLVIPGLRAAKK